MKAGHKSKRNEPALASNAFVRSAHLPPERDLANAAKILNAGRKVAILAGAGALGAGAELEQVANLLGAPIIKPILGKGCVPDDSPFCTQALSLSFCLSFCEVKQFNLKHVGGALSGSHEHGRRMDRPTKSATPSRKSPVRQWMPDDASMRTARR